MKTLFLISIFTIFPISVFGQATVNLQVIASEPPVAVTFSAEGVAAITNLGLSVVASGVSATTLTSAINSSATNIAGNLSSTGTNIAGNLSSTTGIVGGMGLKIDNEAMLVLSNGTVQRGTYGTTPAAHSAGATVTVLRSGDYSQQLANILADTTKNAGTSTPGPTVTAQQAAIATANAAIATALASLVTHN